jgi:hypothetical protein
MLRCRARSTALGVSGSSGPNYRIYRAQAVVQLLNGSSWVQKGNAATWYI